MINWHRLSILLLSTIALSGVLAQDFPTLLPADPFNPVEDAQRLRDSMVGLGTDEQTIIDVLCHRTASQRAEVTTTYNSRFGDLVSDLKDDLNYDFEDLMVSMTYSMTEFLAIALHETMFLPTTDEASLTEILISRNNSELAVIKETFLRRYGFSLADMIMGDTAGSMEALMLALAEGIRDESNVVDGNVVLSDVERLYAAGQGNSGTDYMEFVTIFSERNYPHINAVNEKYLEQHLYSLEYIIGLEFSGSIRDSLLDILEYAQSKNVYFAQRLKSVTAPPGTDEINLNRLIISRCETDLGSIKVEYDNQFGSSLANDVSSDTSGDYRKALLTLIG